MQRTFTSLVLSAILAISSAAPVAAANACTFQGRRGGLLYFLCPLGRIPDYHPRMSEARVSPPVSLRASRTDLLPADLIELARRMAERYAVNPRLVQALISVESGWDPAAVSPKGAKGLMQLMPKTVQRYGVRDPFDPLESLEAGVRYLRELLDEFRDLRLALAAYNAGEEAVRRYGGIPPYPETQAYVREVMRRYRG